jgi:hypothetical protein
MTSATPKHTSRRSHPRSSNRINAYQQSSLDLVILEHLHRHRVLTTTQLVMLADRSERTIRYRLERLRRGHLVGRTRPYVASGSAPAHWWLTASGSRLVSGTSPALGRAAPKPMFIAHTVAIAGVYVALLRHVAESGLRVSGWLRDEESWEEWSGSQGRGSLCPDALLQAELAVDGEVGRAHAFIEVDLGTMTHARLRAKVLRHREYANAGAWDERYPHCPPLLILTTSETRATTFLNGLAKRGRRAIWNAETDDLAPVAICSAARDPDAAVAAPVWHTRPEGAGRRLMDLLADVVRRERRDAAIAAREAAEEAREAPRRALETLRHSVNPRELDDERAEEGVRVAQSLLTWRPRAEVDAWATRHARLLLDVDAWWREQRQSRWERRIPALPRVIAGLHALRDELWETEADRLLAVVDAGRADDRRLPRLAQELADGQLVDGQRINALEHAIDWDAAEQSARDTYQRERDEAVGNYIGLLPWHRRRRVSRMDLAAAWEAEHLTRCAECLVARRQQRGLDRCPICHGALVAWGQAPMVASLPVSLLRLRELRATRRRSQDRQRVRGAPRD